MDELYYVYATAAVIVLYFLAHVITRKFDPFAPVWLFLVGYIQVYIIQAIELPRMGGRRPWQGSGDGGQFPSASGRWCGSWRSTTWASAGNGLVCFPNRRGAGRRAQVAVISPPLILWGLFCAGMLLRGGGERRDDVGRGVALPFLPVRVMVAAILLIVTGRTIDAPGRNSCGGAVCRGCVRVDLDVQRQAIALAHRCAGHGLRLLHRASEAALLAGPDGHGVLGALVVAIAIGWRDNPNYERSFSGIRPVSSANSRSSKILESLNISDDEEDEEIRRYETEEYGGFLLMMDTVPDKSAYDYGANYLRVFSTFIPRISGRTNRFSAANSGSTPGSPARSWSATKIHRPRDRHPGGHPAQRRRDGTLIVLACVALLLRLRTSISGFTPTFPGSSSGGRSSYTTPGSWSSATIRWSGFTTTGGSRLSPSSSSCGSPPSSWPRSPVERSWLPASGHRISRLLRTVIVARKPEV